MYQLLYIMFYNVCSQGKLNAARLEAVGSSSAQRLPGFIGGGTKTFSVIIVTTCSDVLTGNAWPG